MQSSQSAFLLHSRPYRETSLIVDLFCKETGRIAAVARGARANKGTAALLQPFQGLLISFSGNSELKSLGQIEMSGYRRPLQGLSLYSGFYLNELLLKLLPALGGPSELFNTYQNTLEQLSNNSPLEPALRLFELSLLEEMGMGVEFDRESMSGLAITPGNYYLVTAEEGIVQVEPGAANAIHGKTLLAIHQRLWQDPGVLLAAKRICRSMINHMLGGRPLQSRKVLQQYIEVQRD